MKIRRILIKGTVAIKQSCSQYKMPATSETWNGMMEWNDGMSMKWNNST